ncbi:MAG: hypothetical protein GX769_02110 [Erysipelothrix sp.]|nr:hypothetical protein [Erysipelothrix sp.]
MLKRKIITSLVIIAAILTIFAITYDGYNYAPKRIRLNFRYIESDKIHADLDGLQIAFISDIHYNLFMDQERFAKVVSKVNETNPDIIIFLGDLIDDTNLESFDDKTKATLLTQLQSMPAKYGKFAVLGEADYVSEEMNETVKQLLFASDFEVLNNEMIKISKDTNNAFQLIGIDSPLNGLADIETAYKNVNSKLFSLTILHTPDTSKLLPQNLTDLVVAGHSHGGQIRIPLLGQVYNQELAEEYYSGLYNIGAIKLFVTNGVGTTNNDIRIFAPAEVMIYTLKSK